MTAYSTPLYQLFAYVAFTCGIFFLGGNACGQVYNSPTPFNTYYYDYKLANPAFTGTMGKSVITTMYSGLLYNDEWVTKKFYGAYETKLEAIKSGIGAVVQYYKGNHEMSAFAGKTYWQSGVMYSKQLPFSETSGLYLGTQLLYQHLKSDNDYEVAMPPGQLPDTITVGALIGSQRDINEINFDIGGAFYSPHVTIGAALKNIVYAEHDEIGLNLMVKRIFKIGPSLKASPSVLYLTNFRHYNLYINTMFEFKCWLLVGVDYKVLYVYPNDVTFNIGLNIKDRTQVIFHIYSSEAQRFRTSIIETMLRVKIEGKETKEE
jgi:hypothetical protein